MCLTASEILQSTRCSAESVGGTSQLTVDHSPLGLVALHIKASLPSHLYSVKCLVKSVGRHYCTPIKELTFVVQAFLCLFDLKIAPAAFSIRNRGLMNFFGLSESTLPPTHTQAARGNGFFFFLPSGMSKHRCTWGQS